MATTTTDRIEKQVELRAPVARVWRALTDQLEFGEWFRADLDSPFVEGQTTRGRVTYPGYEHLTFEVDVLKMEKERLFSFHWHPYPIDPDVDYSSEPPTLVELRLEEIEGGTRLQVSESGFDALPEERRDEAFRMNEEGWEGQMKNIDAHLAADA